MKRGKIALGVIFVIMFYLPAIGLAENCDLEVRSINVLSYDSASTEYEVTVVNCGPSSVPLTAFAFQTYLGLDSDYYSLPRAPSGGKQLGEEGYLVPSEMITLWHQGTNLDFRRFLVK